MPGTWQGLVNQPTFHTSTMLLLSDGRVMVQEEATKYWHALTPDATGSYVNGTWSTLAPMSFWRRYYASGMLKDGRIIIVGGEQTGDVPDTNKGEIYDPVTDSWNPIPPPSGWAEVGDAACCILPGGELMIGALQTPDCAIFDPATNSWSPAASKAIRSNEETWILQPDNTIVTVQCWDPWGTEKYIISSNTWKKEGPLPVRVVDPDMHEIGPGMLLYDGRTIFFGAANDQGHGKTVIYTPPASPTGTGTWTVGPDIPSIRRETMVCNDCPASLLPNGKVLFAAARFLRGDWGSPIHFFEYDPATNTIAPAPTPPNNGDRLFWSRFMLLPTGQVMFSPSSNDVRIYTPTGGPEEAWRPTISGVTHHPGPIGTDHYLLKGTQLNGLSQANIYGDDCYPATNYPLAKLTELGSGKVYFCRSYGFSTMAVATGASPQSCHFDATHVPYGQYDLCVIANGISSHCVSFCHQPPKKCGSRQCGCKERKDMCCKEDCDRDCCSSRECDCHSRDEIVGVKSEMRSLGHRLSRLEDLATRVEPRQQPKEIST